MSKPMDTSGVTIRYDEGLRAFVVGLTIKGLRDFEITAASLSEAFTELAEELDQEGL